ncbi:hypothetical protein Nepgr_019525 [Nepenthes gracilis]|uniref:RING-type E3 ubiquitin transferase (cysteine targeting) n=1 Tax=Nepenthes gracilis TaxID=150966 RepID=A0AAD3XV47_NEPGR|nr:hypothetical protein Nepgr_019525 [Nepenthes gracilis]
MDSSADKISNVAAAAPSSSSEGWKERIFYPTLFAGIVGGGVGLVSKHRKVHGLANISATYAANFAIVAGCYCGAREFVRASRKSEPDDLLNSAVAGFGTGALLGRLQGGRLGTIRYSIIFTIVGTTVDFAAVRLLPILKSHRDTILGRELKLPEWSPIQRGLIPPFPSRSRVESMNGETPSSSSSSSSSAEAPPEDAWVNTYQRLLPQWNSYSISHLSAIPITISRVNQVDAERLDMEMSAMLKEQLVKVFSLMKPGMLFQYEPELDAFLEFLIWRFSIWVDKPTPGNALMNLRYRDERRIQARGKARTGLEGPGLTVGQKIWYCIATVGGQYIWARLQSFSAFRRWGDSERRSLAQRAWNFLQRLEGFYKAASFGNLLVFLYTGRYRSLIERALRARLVYGSPNMNRSVSFEYMNRQLVWNEFSEMLLLLLPLLNSPSIKSLLWPFSKDESSHLAVDETVCPICKASPTIPFIALPCHHRYCYYCLRTRCSAAPSFRCAKCSEPVTAMQRQVRFVGDPPPSLYPSSSSLFHHFTSSPISGSSPLPTTLAPCHLRCGSSYVTLLRLLCEMTEGGSRVGLEEVKKERKGGGKQAADGLLWTAKASENGEGSHMV